jgi:hypothetical protein
MANEIDMYFLQLVLSLQMGTMQHLGKTVSPVSGQVERNLEMAKHTIEMLEMIHKKTSNSLTDEERKLLDGVLYELRLNYVDEASRGEATAQSLPNQPAEEKSSTPPADNQDKEHS